jgi:hypothetical protein
VLEVGARTGQLVSRGAVHLGCEPRHGFNVGDADAAEDAKDSEAPGVVQRLSANLRSAFPVRVPCEVCTACERSRRRGHKVSQTG